MTGIQWPDSRGWFTAGAFALTFFILEMIREDHTLLGSVPFMTLTTAIVGGTLLLISSNLFGATKSGSETAAKMADIVTSGTGSGTDGAKR